MLAQPKNNQRKYIVLFLIILFFCALFLRLYRIEEFITFLGDQGRDAIVLKRILSLEHLTAIGASSSVGGVYLGPFYYYFIAPWLWLFNFNPVGPAIGVALFSSFYILIDYLIVKEMFDQKVALISSVLITFSSTLISLSRFSWNPNLLPLFSLVTVYFFIKAFNNQKIYFYLLSGAFLSFTVQLHYLSLLLIPPIIIYYIFKKVKDKDFKVNIKYLLVTIITFLIITSPLIIFDFRHQFLNAKSFINLFNHSKNYSQNKFEGFLNTFRNFNQYIFNFKFSIVFSFLLFLSGIFSLFFIKKKANFIFFLLITVFYLVGASLYGDLKSSHYYGAIYSFYYIILAYYLSLLDNKKIIILIILLFGFIYINAKDYYFLKEHGANQIKKAEAVARVINENNKSHQNFSLVSLPELSSDAPYRYFLELRHNKPVETDIPRKTDALFIVCEHPCLTIGNPQWDVAYFAPKKIDQTWKVEGVTIYKLSH